MSEHRHGGPDCREIFARLSEYLDGELDTALCGSLETHLADCPPCQVFLESLRRTVRWIEETDAPPLPDDVRRDVRAALTVLEQDRRG